MSVLEEFTSESIGAVQPQALSAALSYAAEVVLGMYQEITGLLGDKIIDVMLPSAISASLAFLAGLAMEEVYKSRGRHSELPPNLKCNLAILSAGLSFAGKVALELSHQIN